MKKLFIAFLILFLLELSGQCYAVDISDWQRGDSSEVIKGTDDPSDIDSLLSNYCVDPIERLLSHHIWGATITVTSDEVLTISAGEVVCSTGAGLKRFRKNTATTIVDNTINSAVGGIDTAVAVKASTWYYVYAVADANATTFTAILSESAVNPTNANALYYRLIGAALTDATKDWLVYYCYGNGPDITIMWDVPVQITTTKKNAWFTISCATAMPSISTYGIFGLHITADQVLNVYLSIRPTGSTWTTNVEDGVTAGNNIAGYTDTGGQRVCMTDITQQIDYQNAAACLNIAISVEGYYLKR